MSYKNIVEFITDVVNQKPIEFKNQTGEWSHCFHVNHTTDEGLKELWDIYGEKGDLRRMEIRYRTFTNSELVSLIGKKLREIANEESLEIYSIELYANNAYIGLTRAGMTKYITPIRLLKNYTFEDGSACGVLI